MNTVSFSYQFITEIINFKTGDDHKPEVLAAHYAFEVVQEKGAVTIQKIFYELQILKLYGGEFSLNLALKHATGMISCQSGLGEVKSLDG